jgi:hypothetical protein
MLVQGRLLGLPQEQIDIAANLTSAASVRRPSGRPEGRLGALENGDLTHAPPAADEACPPAGDGDDLPQASLTLARTESFHPDDRPPEAEALRETPGRDYRERYRQAAARLEKIAKLVDGAETPEIRQVHVVHPTSSPRWGSCCASAGRRHRASRRRFRQLDDEERFLRDQEAALENFANLKIDLGTLRNKTRFLDFYVGTVPRENVAGCRARCSSPTICCSSTWSAATAPTSSSSAPRRAGGAAVLGAHLRRLPGPADPERPGDTGPRGQARGARHAARPRSRDSARPCARAARWEQTHRDACWRPAAPCCWPSPSSPWTRPSAASASSRPRRLGTGARGLGWSSAWRTSWPCPST